MSAACRTLADCQNLAEYVISLTETVDEGKRKELQRMRRPKLMSLIASRVVPEDVDFLNKIDAMYSTSKDTTEDDDEDDVIVGDFVDELVLDDLLAEDKQEFKMVSDAVKIIDRLHRTRTTGIRSTGLVRQDRQILTNKDK